MEYLGQNLRRLRIGQSLTQEELAEVFGVSAQAVSRWERSETYPDITLLPSIANFFDVTLDALCGMNELRSRERRAAVYRDAHALETQGDWAQAAVLLRRAAAEFPADFSLRSELALALTEIGEYGEAIELSEAVLVHAVSEKVRATTRANLCRLYLLADMPKKAAEHARTLPHVWESRELVTGALGDAAARREAVSLTLSALASMLEGTAPYALGTGAGDVHASLAKLAAFLS